MRYRLIIFILLCTIGVSSRSAEDLKTFGPQSLTVFSSFQTPSNRTLYSYRLAQAGYLSSESLLTFNSFAYSSLQTVPSLIVSDQFAFLLPRKTAIPSPGWQINDNIFTFAGGLGKTLPIILPLQHVAQPEPISLNNYNALWFDYSVVPGISHCSPVFRISTQSRSYGPAPKISKAIWESQSSDLSVLSYVNAQESEWKPMDNFYFIGRQLQLESDAHWRYRHVDKSTLLQRRMHLSLKNALVMEAVVKPGNMLERINLRVHTKDNLEKGEIIEFNNLPPLTILTDGRLGVRLDLRKALQQRFPDVFAKNSKQDKVPPLFLQEMFVYFVGEAGRIVADKPLLGINILGAVNPKEEDAAFFNRLTTEDVALNAYSRRIKLDLGPVNAEGRVDLKKAEINLNPEPNGSRCATRINAVRLVSTYDKKVPVFARQIEDLSRRWGGPFKLTAPEYDQIEQPGIISYLPLNALDEPRVRTNQSVDFHFEPPKSDPGVATAQAARVRSEIGQVNSTGTLLQAASGASLTSNGGMISKANAPGHWAFSGDKAQLDLHWPVNASIGPDTLFYAADGGTEQIAGLAVTIHTADGKQLRRQVSPNTAVPLVKTPTHVKSLQIAISPHALPYHLKIKELVLFEPSVISYVEAFRLRLPRELLITPKPLPLDDVSGGLDLRPGHASGLVHSDTQNLRFTTKLDTPLENLRGLSLKFRLPTQIDTDGPCPLWLTFKFERVTFDRQLCPNTLSGQVFVPLAAWLGKDEAGRKLGTLQSIDWAIHLPGAYAKDMLASFSLDFSIEGWAYQSAADRLLSTPLFQVAGKPVYAKKDSLPADNGKMTNKLWLPLEKDAVERLMGSMGEIIPLENDLFKLEQIVLEPTKPIDSETWDKVANQLKPAVPPWRPKWLLWASILLLAWASARKGWWSPAKTWLFVKRFISRLFWVVSKGTRYLLGRLWFMLPWTATWESRLPGLARLVGWSVVTMSLYGSGLFQKVQKGENYFFTFGGMAAVLALRAIFLLLKPSLRRAYPKLAASIFDGAGSLYFAGAIVCLLLTAFLLIASLEPFAEQLAVVVYYCLVVGMVLEVVALRRNQKSQAETATPPEQERPVT